MRNQLTRMLFVLAAALALWAVPSTAGAHAGNNDPTLLHVCIGNVSKIVRSVGVTGACQVGETADHWRKEGEKGAKGDKGDNGTNGINGINGMDGTSVTFVGNFSGNQNGCPNGGVAYSAGNPPVNSYVCNGIDGDPGAGGGVRANGQCFDDAQPLVDCGSGAVTDTVTGLIWRKQATCLRSTSASQANQAAAGLSEAMAVDRQILRGRGRFTALGHDGWFAVREARGGPLRCVGWVVGISLCGPLVRQRNNGRHATRHGIIRRF